MLYTRKLRHQFHYSATNTETQKYRQKSIHKWQRIEKQKNAIFKYKFLNFSNEQSFVINNQLMAGHVGVTH